MARRDVDKLRKAALEALAVLGPQLIVEEDPRGVEPVRPGHAELGIDALGVVRCPAWNISS